MPTTQDVLLFFNWANDEEVRSQSFSSQKINYEDHAKWFSARLEDECCLLLIFQKEERIDIGQIRIEKVNAGESIIGISISSEFRGFGYATEMLKQASELFLKKNPAFKINAYIKKSNLPSKYAFENAGFEFMEMLNYENFESFHYVKKRDENREI